MTLTPEERIRFAESLKLRGQWREAQPALNEKKPASNAASGE
ncbi:hypothetical protein OKW33_004303 [Paraburkholderia atlantica]